MIAVKYDSAGVATLWQLSCYNKVNEKLEGKMFRLPGPGI